MPTRSAVEELRSANAGIVRLIQADLAAFWASLDLSRPEAARDALLLVLPELVTKYGDVASMVAADWYDEQRSVAGVRGVYRAVPAPAVPVVAVQSEIRFAASHLFTDEPEGTLGLLNVQSSKYALQPGRDTMASNAHRERVRWARVPTGGHTCEFCLMMGSRGFVYRSESSAENNYHGLCDCVPVPNFDKSRIEGYDPKALYADYLAQIAPPPATT